MEVPVYSMTGEAVGSMSIDEIELGEAVNPVLIKQAYVMYHANLRQGSARTKSRGDLTATGKKMYRQKGTGNARHGDRKVPQFKGGGRAFAKRRTREDYHLDMPKKMKRKANRNALLAKLVDSEVKIVEGLSMATPKTAEFRAFLDSLGVTKSALVALSNQGDGAEMVRRSARNLDGITLCPAQQLTAFEMLNHRYLVVDKAELEAWLSGPSSQIGKEAKTAPMGRQEGVGASHRETKPRPKRGHKYRQANGISRKPGAKSAGTSASEGSA